MKKYAIITMDVEDWYHTYFPEMEVDRSQSLLDGLDVALKVMDQDYLKKSIKDTEEYYLQGKFKRKPIMWELWQVITRGKLNVIDSSTWIHINDYTCDVDNPGDLERIMEAMNESTEILRC